MTGLSLPSAMDFAPDGRLFVTQTGGAVRVVKNGALLATPFTALTVDVGVERGLLGLAFDPNYATNRFVYLYHTVPAPTGGHAHNRVTRFTASAANPDVAEAGSDLPILDLDDLSSRNIGGAIRFGPDGKLYVTVGDNAGVANAQTLDNRFGKMLRVNPDGSIPTDNPFYTTASGANRAIWALGLANPPAFSFEPGTGKMHINDVGASTWEEVNVGQAGANYGWASIEGPRTTQTPPSDYVDPIHAYRHPFAGSDPGLVGVRITGGAFYARQPAAAAPFPDSFNGDYFFADLGVTAGNWIRRLDGGVGNSFPFLTGASSPVDLKLGPDGALYHLERGNGNVPGAVQRVRYTTVAPANFDLSAPSDTGLSDSDNVTWINTPTFTGTSAPGDNVRLYVDGVDFWKTMADATGAFSITPPAIPDGTHTLYAVGGAGQGASSSPITVVIDRAAPTVTAAFEYKAAQRVRLTFSEDVRATLAAADLTLGPSHAMALATNGGPAGTPTDATLAPTAILPDGHYAATMSPAAVTDLAGNPLADGVDLPFFVYAADADHDGTVDFDDLVPLAQNYNSPAARSFPDGDFDYDGDVDFDDLVILAQRYNATLGPGAAPAAASATVQAAVMAMFAPPAPPTSGSVKPTSAVAKPIFATTPPIKRPLISRPVASKATARSAGR